MNTQKLYENDLGLWIQQHILLLKESRFSEMDIEHLIEELEDMSKSNQRELKNRLRVLIAHLLKWQYQATGRGTSWKSTIREQRRALNDLLSDAPSLNNRISDVVKDVYEDAVESASEETCLAVTIFPQKCPYTNQQLLDKDFYSEDSGIA